MMISQKGIKPLDNLNHSNEELLLSFAAVFNLKSNYTIHRKAIFNYIQTHKCPRSEENLQGTLEKSKNWLSKGNAMYELTLSGRERLEADFIICNDSIHTFPEVLYSLQVGNHKLNIKSYPDKRGYEVFLNDKLAKPTDIVQLLQLGEMINTTGTSMPREILKFLLKGNYSWEIVNYNKFL